MQKEWSVTVLAFGHVSTQRFFAESEAEAEAKALERVGFGIKTTYCKTIDELIAEARA